MLILNPYSLESLFLTIVNSYIFLATSIINLVLPLLWNGLVLLDLFLHCYGLLQT
jgi:hypothetical protein